MKARIDFEKVLLPKAMQAMPPIVKFVNSSGLDHRHASSRLRSSAFSA